jgi:hypothetical protein
LKNRKLILYISKFKDLNKPLLTVIGVSLLFWIILSTKKVVFLSFLFKYKLLLKNSDIWKKSLALNFFSSVNLIIILGCFILEL